MLDLGSHTDRYRELALVGGTSPVVYRAVHAALGQPVVLKAVPRLSDGSSAQAALFLRGARAAARLKHPHIVVVYDLLTTPNADVIVQEVLDGQPLDEHLAGQPDERLPVERAFTLAAQLADALAEAHKNGLVHRNLSPAAVHLTRGGAVKLGGFEAAYRIDRTGEPAGAADPWDEQTQLGNVHYTSPEQARDGTVTPLSDVYSLGALLYRLLTGRPPITAGNPHAVQWRKLTHKPPPVSKVRADLPPGADDLLGRLLAVNPDHRPRSMADAREAVARFASRAPAAAADRRQVVLSDYPTPIALAYARAWADWDWGVRYDRLLELGETVVRYCAAATVLSAHEVRGVGPPPRLDKLHRPSFGQWAGYLREGIGVPRGASAFVDQMREAAAGSGRGLDLIDAVVQARNDLAHGRAQRPAAGDAKPFHTLLPVVHDLLEAVGWLREYPLVRVEEVDYLDDLDDVSDTHRHLIRYRLCAGVAPSVDAANEILLPRGVKRHRLGLLHPAARTFLDLAPFARYSRCPVCHEEDVFLYNSMPADGRLLLTSGHAPHPFEEETADDPFVRRGLVWSA